ncbi:MAG: DUF4270 domain-containing protein [Dysgonamonadaceae bacterium]|jgi:hypothetical protein|nr:DUF4270 domain-containing protein [Dysgonamonadaceae bacterium]
MKTEIFFLSLLTSFIYLSCEDSFVSEIGTGIMPDEDNIDVFDTVIPITLQTVEVDSIYAKTINGSLGEYYDPTFGSLNAGFACQFYPSVGFDNIQNLVDNQVDSIFLDIYYSYIGDSLTPMELTVYPIDKPLEKNYYTSVDPERFVDMTTIIKKYSYTADSSGLLSIPMPVEWAQRYIDSIRLDPTLDRDKDRFIEMFPGLYFKSTYGSGRMLYVENTSLAIKYRTNEQGKSSASVDSAYWAVTKEIIQINSYKNTNPTINDGNNSTVYIKSPVGMFTEITVPIPKIVEKIGKKKFNSVKLILNAYPKNEWDYSLDFPGLYTYLQTSSGVATNLLLIPSDSTKNFFEQQRVADNVTSYTTTFTSSDYTYTFNNISNLIQYAIDNNPADSLKLLLIPVRTNYTYDSTNGFVDYTTAYDLHLSGVALKSKDQTIRIIASDLAIPKSTE